MIKRIAMTAGKMIIEKRKERFFALTGGDEFQYYIEFDNGSMIGHCKLADLQVNIEKSINAFENIPGKNQY